MSLAAFPVDPALPGLQIASDHEEMRELLRRHLRPLPTNGWDIRDCRLSRVHYHRGDRCTLRYTLRLVEPRTGRERSQWATGLICADDRAGRIWRKLRAADPRQEVPQAFATFEPLSLIPDLEMLVQIFPYDRHLPTLLRLTAVPLPDLEPLFLSQFGSGDWRIETWSNEPVQYRPGRVAVLRHTVQAREALLATSEKKRFYVKVYRDEEEAEQAHRVLQLLRDRARVGGVTVAEPIAYLSGLRALVLGEVFGTSLQEILLQRQDAPAAVRKAARALAGFQREPVAGLRHHRLQDEVAALKRAGQFLEWACPHLRAQVEAIVSAVVADLDEVPPGPTHRELRTDHIFLDGGRLALIDLDSCAAADPLLDPARVLADLAGLSLRLDLADDGRWKAAARVFAEEYLRDAPGPWRNRLFLHYAGAVLKEAVDFFRHQEPHWPENIATLVEEARDALSRRVLWAA